MPEPIVRRRVENARAYVLHARPYSETSLLVEVYSRAYGRLPLLAKGARRARSALRGTLLAFQPLSLGWSGRGEVRTLTRCEWLGGLPLPGGDGLLCGFYINELLLRLMAREDPHEILFDRYEATLALLTSAADADGLACALRGFERALLKELGYALTLDRDARSGDPIDPQAYYRYEPERGLVRADAVDQGTQCVLAGHVLLAIAREDYREPQTLQQCKQLMRQLINHRLDNQPLHSRNVYMELQQL